MFEDIIPLIEQIASDRTVPRNIRERCEESVKILRDGDDPAEIRVNTVISYLDEMSNDPNIPMYTRTQIWNIVSILESAVKK
ncbi:MAG: hypothetical protein GOV02_00355 [Candidatus Aenigmarchaeota archaeon]|nr:hypothetical protein [Candidatus Aenigmarchaeota archaeon]